MQQPINPDGTVPIPTEAGYDAIPTDPTPFEAHSHKHAAFTVRASIPPTGDATSTSTVLIGEGCEFTNGICHVEWYLPEGYPPLLLNSVWRNFDTLHAAIAAFGFQVADL